jgi:adenine phosphoribosyltransferase
MMVFSVVGTMKAACDLMEKVGANVIECLTVIELKDLKGRNKLSKPFSALLNY